ncbi:Sodium/calcium exchanger protein-domain-containing protein [Multifurca ochricompacta]|uniref:Sodium/calcium exchanger protein-domain-containing protein n=1 Tax=Multifurca ochricompacta TaxID=376703 RepID=A0AAD4M7J4_9AGAM|nr:Sodium/calcium exchanger protein-domain-containing protein [Multifurca ochricompacta]
MESTKFVFVLLLILNAVLWSQSYYGQIPRDYALQSFDSHVYKRSMLVNEQHREGLGEDECQPIIVPIEDQCKVVVNSCPTSSTFLSIPYLQTYFCSTPTTRPFIFFGLLFWLIFLFSTLGISASDFFCPNLATIAQLLNLDENVAGVTFLAFGNGSPDVFATFSALRTNAGSLAIGELIGAASFIVSCVVGSMCIIKPFRVNRGPFLRDTTFFTVSVAVLLVILLDGWIYAWEAALLVVLYFVYVFTVVMGSWWEHRREKKYLLEAQVRNEYGDEGVSPNRDDEPYRDDHTARSRLSSLPRLEFPINTNPSRRHPLGSQADSRSPSPSPHPATMPSFSLVGALEFRSVISSLQQEAAGSSLSAFEPPLTPYPGGHYHGYGHSRSRSRGSVHSGSVNAWDASLDVPLNDRSPLASIPSLPSDDLDPRSEEAPLIFIGSGVETQIPEIYHTPASPRLDTNGDHTLHIASTRHQGVGLVLARAFHILFPTLHEFQTKSLLGKAVAVLATPAVFALTITLPVVVEPYHSARYRHEKAQSINDTLVTFEEDGTERILIAEDEVQEKMPGFQFNKWLMAVQCTLGPLFCVAVFFKGATYARWFLLAVGLAGLAAGIYVAFSANKGDHRGWLLARCSMGFLVAMVWIMAIADEVVNVLQTFGFIFGLSDAIIGLTIFAAGNSIADLVANMSVAVFAPIMGFSACFGGPMLNILFGVGISGSYVIHQTAEPYRLDFSNTLLVSVVGLLALLVTTMIFVPMNGYFLPRKWGIFLICFYVVIMTVNVVVEVLGLD